MNIWPTFSASVIFARTVSTVSPSRNSGSCRPVSSAPPPGAPEAPCMDALPGCAIVRPTYHSTPPPAAAHSVISSSATQQPAAKPPFFRRFTGRPPFARRKLSRRAF